MIGPSTGPRRHPGQHGDTQEIALRPRLWYRQEDPHQPGGKAEGDPQGVVTQLRKLRLPQRQLS
jgi:hypothetical protein